MNWFSKIISAIKNFISEVRVEMQKVTWSTREELLGSTAVVLFTMFLMSAFIGVTDMVLTLILAVFLR